MRKVILILFSLSGWVIAEQVQITSPLPLPVSGNLTTTASTMTTNVVSTYTIVSTTYPISVSVGTPYQIFQSTSGQFASTVTVVINGQPTIANTGFNINNTPAVTQSGGPWTVIQTTSGINASTVTVVISGTPNVSVTNTPTVSLLGSQIVQNTTNQFLIQTTTTLNTYQINPSTVSFATAQPITSTYAVVSTTYPIAIQVSTASFLDVNNNLVSLVAENPRDGFLDRSIRMAQPTRDNTLYQIMEQDALTNQQNGVELLMGTEQANSQRMGFELR